MADRSERLKGPWARRVLIGGALAAIAVTSVSLLAAPGRTDDGELREIVLRPQPFVATLNVVGVLRPGAPIDVVAPFDGVVAEVKLPYGDPVRAGAPLLRMDVDDLDAKLRQARVADLRAQAAAADFGAWESSPDVARARRAQQTAGIELADTRRRLQETQDLFDRGLVARSERDALLQQARSQELGVRAAEEDLAAALRKGRGPAREVATLERQASRAALADLEAQRARALVRAPSTGVLVRPPAGRSDEGDLHVGQRLSRGQLIGSVARSGDFGVDLAVAETDASNIRVGQVAQISVPALGGQTLDAEVTSVAGEARPSATGSGPATVAVRVALRPLRAPPAALRIGMTVDVAIVLRQTPTALVAPPGAVTLLTDHVGQVRVRPHGRGAAVSRTVTLGNTAPHGVEVTAGLVPGDVLEWREAPAGR